MEGTNLYAVHGEVNAGVESFVHMDNELSASEGNMKFHHG